MDTKTIQERRQYKRIKKNFVAKFRLKSDKPVIYSQANWEMVTTQNLGAGGALFNYDKKITIGSIIDIFINFPQIKDPVQCTGRVLRMDRSSLSSILKIAANFIDINKEDQHGINKAAEEFYSKIEGRIDV